MIKIKAIELPTGIGAIHGIRNSFSTQAQSDSYIGEDGEFVIGDRDYKLAMILRNKPLTSEAKFARMMHVVLDITAPLYWWKEMDQYKISTTTNSESTMHCVFKKQFDMEDFSFEDLKTKYAMTMYSNRTGNASYMDPMILSQQTIMMLNSLRDEYLGAHQELKNLNKNSPNYIGNAEALENKMATIWREVIQLLPSSYNQLRTWDADYETLHNIYISRKDHKLTEWQEFCKWMKINLPYSDLITGGKANE